MQPAVQLGQRLAGEERAGPRGVTDLRKEGRGGCGPAPTRGHTGRARPPVMYSGSVSSPPPSYPSPTDASMPRRATSD